MFDLLMKPKFYKKCNSAVKMIKVRLETIKKKRAAVEKFLKNDVVELLMNGFDYNAYGKAEGLLIEQKKRACYNFIEQFIERISNHLSVMQKQSECPEECREAIPSLIYAAARLADLPELRDLRTLFTERYGNSLESFLNKEFVQKLRAEPPTKEMKLQLMHDVAQEFSIEWDSKALEQKLFKPPLSQRNEAPNKSFNEAGDDGYKLYGSKNDNFQKRNNHGDENGLRTKKNETDLTSRREDDEFSCSEGEVTDQDTPKSTTTSDESVSENGTEKGRPFYYRFIPPPYVRPALGKEKSITEEPSTRSNDIDTEKNNRLNDSAGESRPNLKPPPSLEVLSSFGNDGAANISPPAMNHKEARKRDQRDEEDKTMDRLLMGCCKKKLPYEWASKWKANLTQPRGRQTAEDNSEGSSIRSDKSDPSSSLDRAATFPRKATSPTETAGRHTRASSFLPDMFAAHVHPKLPEYDDLARQLAALRRG